MEEKLEKLKKEIFEKLKSVKDLPSLVDLEVRYLGRKGDLTKILREIVNLSLEEKKRIGKLANVLKKELAQSFDNVRKKIEEKEARDEFIDVTLPGKKFESGHLNPITLVQKELEDLFVSLGFSVVDGPELESDFFNFEALNTPPNHPARDMQDTFYAQDFKNKEAQKNQKTDFVLRTQTSSVQVRAMLDMGAPLRVVSPGRVFRCESTDVRHEHTFYQFEGLLVDKNINFSHLKGVLSQIGKKLYGQNTKLRMRTKFYPFVEPGVNIEYTCFLCGGKGCSLCKHSGWLEVGGCGMVHPNVLRAGKIDPEKYSGFAFGFGLNRLVMLKYSIEDIRLFNSGDLRFVKQF